MLLNMLKAINAMLDGKPTEETIRCAKSVLGEVIAYLETKTETHTEVNIINPDLDEEAIQAQKELL